MQPESQSVIPNFEYHSHISELDNNEGINVSFKDGSVLLFKHLVEGAQRNSYYSLVSHCPQ